MVERADGNHDTDGLMLRKCQPVIAGGGGVNRNDFAGFRANGLGCNADAVDRPDNLDFRVGIGLAAFARRLQDQFLLPFA